MKLHTQPLIKKTSHNSHFSGKFLALCVFGIVAFTVLKNRASTESTVWKSESAVGSVKSMLTLGAAETKIGSVKIELSSITEESLTVTVRRDGKADQSVQMTVEKKVVEKDGGLLEGEEVYEFKNVNGEIPCFSGFVTLKDTIKAELHWVQGSHPCNAMNGRNRIASWERIAGLMGAQDVYLQDHARFVCPAANPVGEVRSKPFQYGKSGQSYYESLGYVSYGPKASFPNGVQDAPALMEASAAKVMALANPTTEVLSTEKSLRDLEEGTTVVNVKDGTEKTVTGRVKRMKRSRCDKIKLDDKWICVDALINPEPLFKMKSPCDGFPECSPEKTLKDCFSTIDPTKIDDCKCAVFVSSKIEALQAYQSERFDSFDVYKKHLEAREE